MTTANGEFDDLMPHRIKVTGTGDDIGDDGKPINTGGSRTYICLIDDTTTTKRDASGTEVTIALTAYVAPVPVGSETGEPVDIKSEEKIELIDPPQGIKHINSIERHYDAENGLGMLHNIVVRFS
jgi:hypothetical protein